MKYLLVIITLFLNGFIFAQDHPPFWNDVQHFKKIDQETPPPFGKALFIGSSSFTLWKDVQDYFPEYPIVNRAFGGSTLKDLNFYFDDIVLPYNPKQIFIYCGENDFAEDPNVKVETVIKRFLTLFSKIRRVYPETYVIYVSMKPSPSRMHLSEKFKRANTAIDTFLKNDSMAAIVDVYSLMVDENGNPFEHIFLEDKLHMNKKGYEIWQQALYPYFR